MSGSPAASSSADPPDLVAFGEEIGFDGVAVVALDLERPVLDRSAAAELLLERREHLILERRVQDEPLDPGHTGAFGPA